jgi:hypothetical protein
MANKPFEKRTTEEFPTREELKRAIKKLNDIKQEKAQREAEIKAERKAQLEANKEANKIEHERVKAWSVRFMNHLFELEKENQMGSVTQVFENSLGVKYTKTMKVGSRTVLGQYGEWGVRVVDDYVKFAHTTSKIYPRVLNSDRKVARAEEYGDVRKSYRWCYRASINHLIDEVKLFNSGKSVVAVRRAFDTETYDAILKKWEFGTRTVHESQAQDSGLFVFVDGTLVNNKAGIRYKENYSTSSHDIRTKLGREELLASIRETYEVFENDELFQDWTFTDLLNVDKFNQAVNGEVKNNARSRMEQYRSNMDEAKKEAIRKRDRERKRLARAKKKAQQNG